MNDTANGTYEATFGWGSASNNRATLVKNDAGWFCADVQGQSWEYPPPFNPFDEFTWGFQLAKNSPEEALAGFLRAWDEHEPYGRPTEFTDFRLL